MNVIKDHFAQLVFGSFIVFPVEASAFEGSEWFVVSPLFCTADRLGIRVCKGTEPYPQLIGVTNHVIIFKVKEIDASLMVIHIESYLYIFVFFAGAVFQNQEKRFPASVFNGEIYPVTVNMYPRT